MLELARSAISGVLLSEATADEPALSGQIAADSKRTDHPTCFELRRGAFVTVYVTGKLRGCIGVIEAVEPLRSAIVHCAKGAAFQDSRFPSVRREELGDLKVEISILSELQPILADQVEIGKHGLLVAAEGHRGLLLPQVAVEHRLSREQFLRETCHKAGLPRDAWQRSETQLFGFTCEVFEEEGTAGAANS